LLSSSVWAAKGPKELEYAAVLLDGKKIGHVIHSRKVEGDTVRTSDEMNLNISRAGVTLKISTTETCIETLKGKPLGFETLQNITGLKQTAVGTINADGKIDVTITSMGIPQKKVIDWPEGAVMAEGLRLLELDKKLIKGSTYTAKVFTPSLLSAIDASVEVGDKANVDLFGRVLRLTEIKVVMKTPDSDIPTTSYVDENLDALKTIMPLMGMNLEVIACEKEFALSEDDVVDFLDRMFVQCPTPLKDLSQDSGLIYTLIPKKDSAICQARQGRRQGQVPVQRQRCAIARGPQALDLSAKRSGGHPGPGQTGRWQRERCRRCRKEDRSFRQQIYHPEGSVDWVRDGRRSGRGQAGRLHRARCADGGDVPGGRNPGAGGGGAGLCGQLRRSRACLWRTRLGASEYRRQVDQPGRHAGPARKSRRLPPAGHG
jgi:hypothetical protein